MNENVQTKFESLKPKELEEGYHQRLHDISDAILEVESGVEILEDKLESTRKEQQEIIHEMQDNLQVIRTNMINNDKLREEISTKEGLDKPMAKTTAWTTKVNKELTKEEQNLINMSIKQDEAALKVISRQISADKRYINYLKRMFNIEINQYKRSFMMSPE